MTEEDRLKSRDAAKRAELEVRSGYAILANQPDTIRGRQAAESCVFDVCFNPG